jgi:hypothetical protein
MKTTTAHRLTELKKQMHTSSTKPLQRLRASLAAREYNAIVDNLPGSARRGLMRGKEIS